MRCSPRSPGRADRSSSARIRRGGAMVANLPATLPSFFRTFCKLNEATEAVIAGDERLTYAELDRWSERLAQGAGRARDRQGRPRRHRDAQLPELDPVLHGGGQGRRGRDPAQRLVAARRVQVRAGAVRAGDDHRRRAARGAAGGRRLHRAADRARGRQAGGGSVRAAARGGGRRRAARGHAGRPCDDPVHVGIDRDGAGRLVDPPGGGERMLRLRDGPDDARRRSWKARGGRRPTRRGPCSTCRCSTSPARCR